MSGSGADHDWRPWLEPGEQLSWQGAPATTRPGPWAWIVARPGTDTLLLGWFRRGQGSARPFTLGRWLSGDGDHPRRFAFRRIRDGAAVQALVHRNRMALMTPARPPREAPQEDAR